MRGKSEPPPKIGRPSNEDVKRRQADEARQVQHAQDLATAAQGWKEIQGKVALLPVEQVSKHVGGEFALDDSETRLINDAVPLYTKHRIGWNPEGDKVFDYFFWGSIVYVVGRRLMALAVAAVIKKTGWIPPGMEQALKDDAPDIRNQGDGKDNPGPVSPGEAQGTAPSH